MPRALPPRSFPPLPFPHQLLPFPLLSRSARAGSSTPDSSHDARASATTPAAHAPVDPQVAKGQALFAAGPCSSCHGAHGEGTTAAGPLTGVGAKYTQAQLLTILRTPTANMADGEMEPVNLNDTDLAALGKFLRQLH